MQIVELLRQRPFAVGDIAEELGIRQPQASEHLGALREAGIVTVEAGTIEHINEVTLVEQADVTALTLQVQILRTGAGARSLRPSA